MTELTRAISGSIQIVETLGTAAELIAERDPSDWVGYALALIEDLDSRAPNDGDAFLEVLQRTIAHRLECGSW
ncbi:MAG: hypothetical protein ACOC9T_00070 [Myxococcota bacterium]